MHRNIVWCTRASTDKHSSSLISSFLQCMLAAVPQMISKWAMSYNVLKPIMINSQQPVIVCLLKLSRKVDAIPKYSKLGMVWGYGNGLTTSKFTVEVWCSAHPIPSQEPVWRSTLASDFGDPDALGECLVLEFQAQEGRSGDPTKRTVLLRGLRGWSLGPWPMNTWTEEATTTNK